MKKTITKMMKNTLLLLLLFSVMFAVLVYCYFEYEQIEKNQLSNIGVIKQLLQSNKDFLVYVTYIYPACLYSFLGNRYLRIIKMKPYKTVYEKINMAFYTLLFFIAGELITAIPVNLIMELIYSLYCHIFNLEIFGFTTATAPFVGIFSSAVAICAYQNVIEKHLSSIKMPKE